MFTITNEEKGIALSYPQSLREITKSDLNRLTANINIPDNKIVICIARYCNLFELQSMVRTNRTSSIGVACLIAKCSDKIKSELHCDVGDNAIIATSSIERGNHVSINTAASYSNLCNLIKEDKEFTSAIIKGLLVDEKGNKIENLYCIEFKIVDSYDVVGSTVVGYTLDDPYKVCLEMKNEEKS